LVDIGLAPGAVDLLVQPAWRARQVGDGEPAVRTPLGGLDAGDHPPLDRPALGGVAVLGVAADLGGPVPDPLQRHGLGEACHAPEQDLVAGKTEEVGDPVALTPAHRLVASVVAVAADQDVDLRPASADGGHDVAQDEHHLGPVRGLAGTQDHRHRLATSGLVDVDRQKAALVVVGMEEGQLLATVNGIAGVVDVQHDPSRHLLEAVAEQLDHGGHHALERGRAGQVLQPAHGRLRA